MIPFVIGGAALVGLIFGTKGFGVWKKSDKNKN